MYYIGDKYLEAFYYDVGTVEYPSDLAKEHYSPQDKFRGLVGVKTFIIF